jgi:hypothetical protein
VSFQVVADTMTPIPELDAERGGSPVVNSIRRLFMAVTLLAAILSACVGAGATASPAAVTTAGPASAAPIQTTPVISAAAASALVSPTAPPTTGAAATPPSQTDTAWGRIWDSVPASFPRFPGAEPTVTGSGAASATLQLSTDAANGAKWYQTALEAAGFATDGMNGPLEDGSIVIDSHGATTGCKVQTSIAPIGGRTIATIMFGASCPFS